ncbi:MAG: hypothetical protein KAG97_11125, partial [Victivallales bacterium]|nr:hypothetical protein [Victivallales bacterium]
MFLALAVIAVMVCLAVVARADTGYRIIVKAAGMKKSVADEVKATALARMAEAADFIGHEPRGPYVIIITNDRREFERHVSGAPDWAVAIYAARTVVITPEGLSAHPENFYNTIHHELVHAALDHLFIDHPRALPLWLNEGLAVTLSDSWEIPLLWEDRRMRLYA